MSVWGWFAGFVNISRDPSGLQLNLVIGLQLKLPVMAAGEIPRKWNFFFVNEFKSIILNIFIYELNLSSRGIFDTVCN